MVGLLMYKSTEVGLPSWAEIGFSWLKPKWLDIQPSCKDNIFYSLCQPLKSRIRSLYLKNWQTYGLTKLKIEMSVAALVF